MVDSGERIRQMVRAKSQRETKLRVDMTENPDKAMVVISRSKSNTQNRNRSKPAPVRNLTKIAEYEAE